MSLPLHSVNFCRFHWNSGRLALNICACWKYTLELNEETNLKLELGGIEPTHRERFILISIALSTELSQLLIMIWNNSYVKISIKSVAFFVRFLSDFCQIFARLSKFFLNSTKENSSLFILKNFLRPRISQSNCLTNFHTLQNWIDFCWIQQDSSRLLAFWSKISSLECGGIWNFKKLQE